MSVVVAELVMDDVESRALATCPCPPKFWKHYVDDTFCALKTQEVDKFHRHINSTEETIQFTTEKESESKIAFLDVLVSHSPDKTLNTTGYRKSTHTDKYLDFNSNHPIVHKLAVIRTLNHRAHNLLSSPSAVNEEEVRISQALKMNGYPRKLIENPPQSTHHNLPSHSPATAQPQPSHRPATDQPQTSQDVTSPNPTFVTIPYVKNTSEAISRILSPLGIKTTFQPINTLKQLIVHPKDPIPKEDKAGVVYQIPCSDCPQTYIGQTGRTLGQRIKEHKKAVKDRNVITSALAEHTCQTGHTIDWSQTEILGTNQNTSRRCLLESWMIQKEPHTLNRELGTLPTTYKQLF